MNNLADTNAILPKDELTDFLLYTAPGGDVRVEVFLHNENVWLTQKRMAELFDVETNTINYHLKEVFSSEELAEDSVIRKIRITAADGKMYLTNFYNLDAIIAVGYRVNSKRATQFRIWATKTLREYIIKGFAIDDERLKNGRYFGKDYFRELLERVRSIRASERRMYLQITDIFAECSIDYDPKSAATKEFFMTVQNKFHYAISGQTAPEIIHSKADKSKDNMGLTVWNNSPDGRILQSDVLVAKNYLPEKDIKRLERTVSGFFDYIENIIESRTEITMTGFAEAVNKFLAFNEYRVLSGKGKISRQVAEAKAIGEYAEYNKRQHIESDFEKFAKELAD
jgi:hypothetical protein